MQLKETQLAKRLSKSVLGTVLGTMIGATLGVTSAVGTTAVLAAPYETAPNGTERTSEVTAGLKLPTSEQFFQNIEIPQQRVVSDRGADFLAPLGFKSSFISQTTSPAAGRRVRVWNTTPGFRQDEIPFTERAYSDAEGAEPFVVVPNSQHQTRWFSVLPGSEAEPMHNSFRYEITDAQGEVLEQGEFSVAIALNPEPVTTTFRYGPDHAYRYYPTDSAGIGFGVDRSFAGRALSRRELFKQRQQFKRDNSGLFRLRDR